MISGYFQLLVSRFTMANLSTLAQASIEDEYQTKIDSKPISIYLVNLLVKLPMLIRQSIVNQKSFYEYSNHKTTSTELP